MVKKLKLSQLSEFHSHCCGSGCGGRKKIILCHFGKVRAQAKKNALRAISPSDCLAIASEKWNKENLTSIEMANLQQPVWDRGVRILQHSLVAGRSAVLHVSAQGKERT